MKLIKQAIILIQLFPQNIIRTEMIEIISDLNDSKSFILNGYAKSINSQELQFSSYNFEYISYYRFEHQSSVYSSCIHDSRYNFNGGTN